MIFCVAACVCVASGHSRLRRRRRRSLFNFLTRTNSDFPAHHSSGQHMSIKWANSTYIHLMHYAVVADFHRFVVIFCWAKDTKCQWIRQMSMAPPKLNLFTIRNELSSVESMNRHIICCAIFHCIFPLVLVDHFICPYWLCACACMCVCVWVDSSSVDFVLHNNVRQTNFEFSFCAPSKRRIRERRHTHTYTQHTQDTIHGCAEIFDNYS